MDKKLKAKWVKALRSGEYKQGKGYLEDRGKFCCLGVLADAVGRERLGIAAHQNSFLRNARNEEIVLPVEVQRALADLNDRRVPFEVIAGLINEAL